MGIFSVTVWVVIKPMYREINQYPDLKQHMQGAKTDVEIV